MLKKEIEFLQDPKILDTLLNKIGIGLFLMDNQTRLIWANQEYQNWFGKLENIKGKPCSKFIAIKEKRKCACEKTKVSKKVETGYCYGGTPKTKNIFFESTTTPIFDNKRKIKYMMGRMEDITERKLKEEQIENLSKFPEENPNLVFRVDARCNILFCNPSCKKIVNKHKLKSCLNILPKEFKKYVKYAIAKNKPIVGIESEFENKTTSFDFQPIKEGGYVNIYGKEITKLKEAEARILRYTGQLERKVRERTKELEKKNEELNKQLEDLEKFHRFTIGRELKMIELKKQIKSLERKRK